MVRTARFRIVENEGAPYVLLDRGIVIALFDDIDDACQEAQGRKREGVKTPVLPDKKSKRTSFVALQGTLDAGWHLQNEDGRFCIFRYNRKWYVLDRGVVVEEVLKLTDGKRLVEQLLGPPATDALSPPAPRKRGRPMDTLDAVKKDMIKLVEEHGSFNGAPEPEIDKILHRLERLQKKEQANEDGE